MLPAQLTPWSPSCCGDDVLGQRSVPVVLPAQWIPMRLPVMVLPSMRLFAEFAITMPSDWLPLTVLSSMRFPVTPRPS